MLFQKRVVCTKLDFSAFIDCVKQVCRKLKIPLWSIFMAMPIHMKYNVKPFSFFRKRSGFRQSQFMLDRIT